MAMDVSRLSLEEQLAFWRSKVNLPTEKWNSILKEAHDRAFTVAGALQADLLADLRAAVDHAITEGDTLETFQKDFDTIVATQGWTGWTGEGTAAGEAWRTKVIYDTNLFTSYSAGRYRQLQAVKATRPYWRYRHSPASVVPRPEHLAWDGKVLPADDAWWTQAMPPGGFGCKCYVESLSPRDLERLGLAPISGEDMPYAGETDPATGLPRGIDEGWDYQPGASVADELDAMKTAKADDLKAAGLGTIARQMLDWIAKQVS
jgi:uncharacterized protein with gpF-like domain